MQTQCNKYSSKKIHFSCNMFTLIELLLVISIIAILSGLLQPLLFKAKERAKYTKWLVYTKNIKSDSSLVGQWTFDSGNLGLNSAQGFSVGFYNSKEYNAKMFGTASAKNGRWHKESIYLAGNQNSYLQIDDGALYNPGKEDMTIIVWFKPTTKNTRFIISKGNGSNRDPGWSFYQNKKFHIRARSRDKQQFRNRNKGVLELDRWHFAALVVDNSNKRVQMYLDNKMIYSGSIKVKNKNKDQTADFTASEKYTVIGKRAGRRGGYFRGYIDEVEIFKRALTPTEIKQFYDIGSNF